MNYFSLTTDNAGRTEVPHLPVSGWAYEVKLHWSFPLFWVLKEANPWRDPPRVSMTYISELSSFCLFVRLDCWAMHLILWESQYACRLFFCFVSLHLVLVSVACNQWSLIHDVYIFPLPTTYHFRKLDTGYVSSLGPINNMTTLNLTFKTSSHSITLIKYSFKSNESDLNMYFVLFFTFLWLKSKKKKTSLILKH